MIETITIETGDVDLLDRAKECFRTPKKLDYLGIEIEVQSISIRMDYGVLCGTIVGYPCVSAENLPPK